MDFFYRADAKLRQGQLLADVIRAELKKYRVVSGYGRPIVDADERILPLLRFAKLWASTTGITSSLRSEFDDYLKNSRYKYQINVAALAAAILADQGLSPEELYNLATLAFVAGMFPCYIDTREKPEGAFFPLRASRIHYAGAETRRWG